MWSLLEAHQIVEANTEDAGQLGYNFERGIPFTVFDEIEIGVVDSGKFRQFLLAHTFLFSQFPDFLSEFLCHRSHALIMAGDTRLVY